MDDASTDSQYRAWCAEVSAICEKRLALRLDDLPDLLTRIAFDDGVTPQEFFDCAVVDLVREEFGDLALRLE